jgi:hypothetical protein
MKMKRPRGAEENGKMDLPFGSALTGPALVTAVLFVAGFSYEWAFYYNFGLEHIARQRLQSARPVELASSVQR